MHESTTYGTASVSGTAADGAMIIAIFITMIVMLIAIYVVSAIFLGMIFKKAGIESWKAWVPLYNNWVLLEMGGQQGWIALLSLIPGASIVTAIFMYIAMYHISIKFGKDGTLFLLLAILMPIVWFIWLAVDKTAVWNHDYKIKPILS